MRKRILCMLLALIMIFSLLPIPAYAGEADPEVATGIEESHEAPVPEGPEQTSPAPEETAGAEEAPALYQEFPELKAVLSGYPELEARVLVVYNSNGSDAAFIAVLREVCSGTLDASDLDEIINNYPAFADFYSAFGNVQTALGELRSSKETPVPKAAPKSNEQPEEEPLIEQEPEKEPIEEEPKAEEPRGLVEQSYPFSLSLPVKINGVEYTVTMSDTVINSPTQTCLEKFEPSVSADGAEAYVGTPVSNDKQSIRYPVTVNGYSFSVTFTYYSLTGTAGYSVDAPGTDKFMVEPGTTLTGSFAKNEEGFSAGQQALAFTAMELLGEQKVTINWNDNHAADRPAPTYTLYAGNAPVADGAYELSCTPSAYNTDTVTVDGKQLPLYSEDGAPIHYEVKQSSIDGYIVSNNSFVGLDETLVNTRLTSITVTKPWYDDKDVDGERPGEEAWLADVKLWRQTYNNNTIGDPEELSFTADQYTLERSAVGGNEIWTLTVSGLPMYDEYGNPLEYSISDSVSETDNGHHWHYANRIENVNEYVNAGYQQDRAYNGGALISTRTAEQELTFHKKWDDGGSENRPDITLYLYRMLREELRGSAEVSLSPVAGMDSMTVPGSTFGGGKETYEIPYEVDGKTKVPRYDGFGKEYLYFAAEEMSGELAKYYTQDGIKNPNDELDNSYLTNGGTVTNKTEHSASIQVKKTWDAKSVMGSVKGTETSSTFVLQRKENGGWTDVLDSENQPYMLTLSGFSEEQTGLQGVIAQNLPTRDAQHREIEYRVVERAVTFMGSEATEKSSSEGRMTAFTADGLPFTVDYGSVQEDDQGNLLFEVTNRMEPTRDVQILKTWDQTPEYPLGDDAFILIRLYCNSEPYALTAENTVDSLTPGCEVMPDGTLKMFANGLQSLAAVVRNLPVCDPTTGSAYVWTALEDVENSNLYGYGHPTYTVDTRLDQVTDSGDKIHTISVFNSHEPGEGQIKVLYLKHWLDGEAASTRKPVEVQLYHTGDNGEEAVGEPVELSDANNWYQEKVYTLDDPVRDHYFTREISADGHSVEGDRVTTGDAQTGYTYKTSSELRAPDPDDVLAKLGYTWVSETTNKRVGRITLSVDKTWKTGGVQYKSVFEVHRNGEKLFDVELGEGAQIGKFTNDEGYEVTVTNNSPENESEDESDNGANTTYAFSVELDKYDANGFLYSYDVKETSITVDGKVSPFSNNKAVIEAGDIKYHVLSSAISDYHYGDYHTGDKMAASFTNTFAENVSLVVYKLWRDVATKNRPDIVMNLYRRTDSEGAPELVTSCYWDTHTSKYFWMCTFGQQKFPMFDDNGNRYEYYVQEQVLNGSLTDYFYTNSYYNGVINGKVNVEGTTTQEVFSELVDGGDTGAKCGYVSGDCFTIEEDKLVEAGIVINTLNRTTTYTGTKVWKNLPAWFELKDLPKITVALFRTVPAAEPDAEPDAESDAPKTCMAIQTLTNGNRTIQFNNVERYDTFGNEYTYTIAEVEVVVVQEGDDAPSDAYRVGDTNTYVRVLAQKQQAYDIYSSNGIITNTYHGGSCGLTLHKTWVIPTSKAVNGKYAYPSVTFSLKAKAGIDGKSLEALEITLPGGEIASGADTTLDPTTVVLDKKDLGRNAQVTSASVSAVTNGDIVEITVSAAVSGLEEYAPNSIEYTWTIKEGAVNGYKPQTTEDPEDQDAYVYGNDKPIIMSNHAAEVSFTNVYDNAGATLSAKKIWTDSGNAFGTRPDYNQDAPALTLTLFRNGSEVTGVTGKWVEEKTNEWIYQFTSTAGETFPQYDTAGNAYRYTVKESWNNPTTAPAILYELDGSSGSRTQPTITNKLKAYTKLFVDKSWVDQGGNKLTTAELLQLKKLGYAPDSLTFQVLQKSGNTWQPSKYNEQDVTMTVPWADLYASVANNTLITFTFADKPLQLPMYDSSNNLIQYAVREVKINDTPVSGDGEVMVGTNKFTVTTGALQVSGGVQTAYITNKLQTQKLRFVKHWNDQRNRDGVRPKWDVADPELSLTVTYTVGSETKTFTAPDKTIGSTAEWTGRWVLNEATNIQDVGEWSYEITVPGAWTITGVTENCSGASWETYYNFGTAETSQSSDGRTVYTVTNTHEIATFDLAVRKDWVDDENAWNTRSNTVGLTLKQSGKSTVKYAMDNIAKIEEHLVGDTMQFRGTTEGLAGVVSTVIATATEGTDIAIWYELPIFKPKTNATNASVPYTYKVEETEVKGYTRSYKVDRKNGSEINNLSLTDKDATHNATVTNTLNTRTITAKKVWRGDYGNAFGSRVGGLVFVLTVKNSNDDLLYVKKKPTNGSYQIVSDAPDDVDDALTNYVTVTIGSTTDGATAALPGIPIPKDHGGYKWNTAQLIEVNRLTGYESTENSIVTNSAITTTTTNTLIETIPLKVTKTWDDVEFEYDYVNEFRPKLYFAIWYRIDSGEWKKSGITGCADVSDSDPRTTEYTLYKENDSSKTPLALPQKTADGKSIDYDVVEQTMSGYDKVSGEHSWSTTDAAATIHETNKQQRTEITVQKVWEGDEKWREDTRPTSVTLTLQVKIGQNGRWTGVKQNGEPVQVELSEDNNWKATVSGLAARATGGRILYYRFVETDTNTEAAYTPSYGTIEAKINQSAGTVKTTNTLRTVTLTGKKVWAGDGTYGDGTNDTVLAALRGSISLKLYRDDALVDSGKYNVVWNGWNYSISGLPKADKNGNVYTYRVEEDTDSVSQAYEATDFKADPVTNGVYNLNDITNTLKTVVLEGTKLWDDDSNRDGFRPENITLEVYQQDTQGSSTKLATTRYLLSWQKPDNTWTYTISGLPQMDASGNLYSYSVKERAVEKYTTSYGESRTSAEEQTSSTQDTVKTCNMTQITNTHVPERIEISGSKTWVDANNADKNRPSTITVNLLANGIEKDSKTVTAANNWAWSFENLYKYENGQEINYTVTEEAVEGYTATINGYNITNSRTAAKLSIKKVGENSEPLSGAIFSLYAVAGSDTPAPSIPAGSTPYTSSTSGTDGIADFGSVDVGRYLVEEQPPEGYVKPDTPYLIDVAAAGVTMKSWNGSAWVNVPDFTVVNKRQRTDVTIDKQVTGELGDREKFFTFTATCTEPMQAGEGYDLSEDGKTATFSLKHGDSVTLKGVPVGKGAELTIKEDAAEGYSTCILVDGNSEYGTERTVAVVDGMAITVENDKSVIPDAGVLLDSLPYVLILAGVAAAAVFLFIRKRRCFDD